MINLSIKKDRSPYTSVSKIIQVYYSNKLILNKTYLGGVFMTGQQKRKMRKAIKQKRIELLARLDALEAQLTEITDIKDSVEIQKQIYEVGKQLQQQVYFSVESPFGNKDPVFKPIEVAGPPRDLNIQMYLSLKQRGFTDSQVALSCGQTKGYVDRFKRADGITKTWWKEQMYETT